MLLWPFGSSHKPPWTSHEPVANQDHNSDGHSGDISLKCRDVDIRYLFGIGPGCFRPGFEIIYDNRGSGVEVKPRLPTARGLLSG
jgi:hypothetical protein